MCNKNVSHEDLNTMFTKTLVTWKGKPYYVLGFTDEKRANLMDIATQKKAVFSAEATDMKPPARMGFVNFDQGCVYLMRIPVRRYRVGVHSENVRFMYPRGYEGLSDLGVVRRIARMTDVSLADMVHGVYPTLSEAQQQLKGGISKLVAFDRQFAIDRKNNIYYKQEAVGTVKEGANDVYDIVFKDCFKYLITLLDRNYEKSLSAA